MTLNNCFIFFPKYVYNSGETVTGKVSLTLDRNKQCSGLLLNIFGEGHCKWTETPTDGSRQVTRRGDVTYFQTSNDLMAEQYMEVGSSDLVAGNHSFEFKFILPKNLPSSLEAGYGYTRYKAEVVFKRQYKGDLRYQTSFSVLSHIDLNLKPQIKKPILNEQHKKLRFLFSKKGTIYMTVKLPYSGFVSGQKIPVTCHLKNDSKVKVDSVKASLIKRIYYYAKSYSTNGSTKISVSSSGETNCGEEKTHELSINIPPTPTTTLPECGSIIDTKYELKVTASIAGMYDNLSYTIPIMIGTVPLVSNLSVPEKSQSSILRIPKKTPTCSKNDPPQDYLQERLLLFGKLEK